MAKKKTAGKDPSDCVRDNFRMRDGGDVEIPVNSKSSTDDFHLDRSTLGTHTEYDPTIGKYGECVQKQNHVKQHARETMGDLRRVPASKEGTEISDPCNRGFRAATQRHTKPCNMAVPTPFTRG